MKFSVVTISFNQAPFIEQAIKSVLEQDVDIEYIVVDAGSTDGSRDIIEKYRDQIDYVILEPDDGPIDGLNKGFQYATGDILCCLNSDDYYLPGGLKKAERIITADPSSGAWVGAGVIVNRDSKIVKPCYSGWFSPRRYVLGYAVAIHQSTFYKKCAFDDVGGFNPENLATWDGEILYWMMRKGYAVSRNFASIGAFRIYDESLTGSGILKERIQADRTRLAVDLNSYSSQIVNRALKIVNSKASRALIDPKLFFRNVWDKFIARSKSR